MADGGYVELESDTAGRPRAPSCSWATTCARQRGFGGYQAILRDDKNGVYVGASESRKDGQAAGY